MTLRPVGDADLTALVALEAPPNGAGRWGRVGLAASLRAPTDRGWLLLNGAGAATGFALIRWVPGDERAELLLMGVAAAWRRRGAGGALLRTVVAWARQRGCQAVLLEVRQRNAAAQALYVRAGFVAVGRRPAYYGDDGDAAILMTYWVTPGVGDRLTWEARGKL